MAADPLWVGAVVGEPWVAVAYDADGLAGATVHEEIGDLWRAYGERATGILVDVPMGLPEERPRRCDALARDLLGPRAVAVLDPPVREAARKRRFRAAARAHERATDQSLSEAAFHRREAILLVDELLAEVPEARDVLAPGHPELCFRAFAGDPLERDPTTAGGYAERLRTLASVDHDAPPALLAASEEIGGESVEVADTMAAMALAYTARPGGGELRTLPAEPESDEEGVPVRWVYRSEDALEE